jgi:ABC-type transport system involved in multi-copper enzyme maturation permease subunit
MRHALVIAGRELAEKRFVFFAAIAFALLAAVMPLVPGMQSSPREAIATTSMLLTAGFTLGLAGILGASMVGRDLSTGRMSFYFARPAGAASIWFGKLAAALVLVVASFAIVLLPGIIATGGDLARGTTLSVTAVAAQLAVLVVLFFFVAHAASTMIRSHSVLIGLDFAAALLTGFLLWQLARPLIGTTIALGVLLGVFALAALSAFLAAGAWQLADGRTDRRRGHAAFSKALWSGMAVALLLAAGVLVWIFSATPRDLTEIAGVEPSPRGDWLFISGVTRHRFDFKPAYLVNAKSGAWQHIPEGTNTIFSADGSKILQVRRQYNEAEVVIRDTATGRTTETGVRVKPVVYPVYPIVATDDLSRFATYDYEQSILTVYDTVAHRFVGSAHLRFFSGRFYFASPDVLRFWVVREDQISTYEFDAAHQALRRTGSIGSGPVTLRVTADGARVATHEEGAASVVLRDARTLQPLASVPLPSATSRFNLLHDGRVLTVDGQKLGVAGTPFTVDLGAKPLFVADIGGGKVVAPLDSVSGGIVVVDVDRGTIVRREDNIHPVLGYSTQFDPRTLQWTPNLIVGRGRGGTVLRWNALTGETKVLVPRG